jgi:hypothetical protein
MRPIDRSVLLSQKYRDGLPLEIFHGTAGMTFDGSEMHVS